MIDVIMTTQCMSSHPASQDSQPANENVTGRHKFKTIGGKGSTSGIPNAKKAAHSTSKVPVVKPQLKANNVEERFRDQDAAQGEGKIWVPPGGSATYSGK